MKTDVLASWTVLWSRLGSGGRECRLEPDQPLGVPGPDDSDAKRTFWGVDDVLSVVFDVIDVSDVVFDVIDGSDVVFDVIDVSDSFEGLKDGSFKLGRCLWIRLGSGGRESDDLTAFEGAGLFSWIRMQIWLI